MFTSGIKHKQLIKRSLLENETRYVILHNQALPKFYTRESSWRRGHGGKMYVHDVFFVFFFFSLIPIFPPFSLSFLPFLLHFSCAFRMLGYLSRAWLALTGLHNEGTTVDRTFLVRTFDHFFLTLEAFRAFPLHARELLFILFLHRILPY